MSEPANASDLELLARYTRHHAEDAFATLVRRHVDLVHSAALRQVRSPQLAEEVAQTTFTKLARLASQLAPDTILTAWLYQVTRREAIDVVRREARRQLREQIATELNTMNATTADWAHIEPILDEAMAELDDTERAAVLLRYFENKSLREVGDTLGTSDDAAQKRVSRAVERLREFFVKRGITVGTSGLAVVISANAVQAAPVGLIVTISTAAALAGTTLATTTTAAAINTIAMTTLQKTIVTATFAVLAGVGIYEARQAAQLRDQVQTLQQQQAPLSKQIVELNQAMIDATNQLAALRDDNERLNRNTAELLSLRSEAAGRKRDASQLKETSTQAALAWILKKEKLQRLFEENPDRRIPDMRFLTEKKWLDLAKDADLDSEKGKRFAIHFVRYNAKATTAPMIKNALKKFIDANNGSWPADTSQLKAFLVEPVDDEILERYRVLTKNETQTGWLNGMVLIEKVAENKWQEPQRAIGPESDGVMPYPEPVHLEFPQELKPVMEAYQNANSLQTPDDMNKLKPYAITSEQKTALEQLLRAWGEATAPE